MNAGAQLVLTHGTSDLQILLRDDAGRRWRAQPDKAITRRFHAWLLEHADEAEVIDVPPELLGSPSEATFTDWSGDTFCLWLGDEAPDAHPERSPEGRLQLMLPKLQPTLDSWLKAQDTPPPAGSSPALAGVLVLSTDRGEEREPIATYTFLARWLLQRGLPASAIREVVYLLPGEKLEGDDSPVAPAIAARIERALRDFYDRSSRHQLLIASVGGLPQIKPLLAEIAVLLAGQRAQSLFKTEHGALGLLPRTPLDTLRVRRQCLEQVQRGALLDAWAIAAPCRDDPDARPWLRPLQQAAQLINGNPLGARVELPALQRLLDHAQRATCLLVAIRVETALQTERWLEAINGSLTFLEAAFHDAVHQWALQTLEAYDPRRRYMRFRNAPDPILLESGEKGEKPALVPWKGQKAGVHEYQANMVGSAALGAWEQILGNEPLKRLRAAFHNPQPYSVHRPSSKLADYRNFNTHGVMTQDEIDQALKRFMGADLWGQNIDRPDCRPKPGNAFLGRALISEVIGSLLGPEAEPAPALYQALLQQLTARLIDPTCPLS